MDFETSQKLGVYVPQKKTPGTMHASMEGHDQGNLRNDSRFFFTNCVVITLIMNRKRCEGGIRQ